MFRPHVDYIWHQKVRIYKEKFGAEIPQWLLTLDNIHAVKILSLAIKCKWNLPTEVLVAGESYSGFQCLWSDRKNKWDGK